jgi:prepilin-type N-terminal cleavage/methylation domain-containing protein
MKYKGFTLIELLIVLAIMSILLVGSVVALVSSRSSSLTEEGQKELASEISLARAYALQGKTQNGATPCGYGARFVNNQQQYSIFYNTLDTALNCDIQNTNSTYLDYSSGKSTILETKTLPGQVKISNSGDLTVYFTVPNGTVYSNGSSLSYGATKSVSLNNNGTTKKININSTGLVTTSD